MTTYISRERENVLQLHGLWYRYNNVKEHVLLCAYSASLHPVYKKHLKLLESADVYCSIGCTESHTSIVSTRIIGKHKTQTFYINKAAPSTALSALGRELEALKTALKSWAAEFENKGVCFITNSDQLYALLEFSPSQDDSESPIATVGHPEALDIKAQLQRYNVYWDIFSVPKACNSVVRLAANSVLDEVYNKKFLSFMHQFVAPESVVKVMEDENKAKDNIVPATENNSNELADSMSSPRRHSSVLM